MHTPDTTTQTLDLLWGNYLTLAAQVDTEAMDPETLLEHTQQQTPVQPLRLATWLTRQSFFLAAWALWEQYSTCVCVGSNAERPKLKQRTHVEWVRDTMASQDRTFRKWQWFLDARCIRNLIAHYAGRVHDQKGHRWLEEGRRAFPGIDVYRDGYLRLRHEDAAELQIKIEEYVEDSIQFQGHH